MKKEMKKLLAENVMVNAQDCCLCHLKQRFLKWLIHLRESTLLGILTKFWKKEKKNTDTIKMTKETKKMQRFVIIMAGGEGTRFYPLSTVAKPKQFTKLIGDKTLFQQTYERAGKILQSKEDFIVVLTQEKYFDIVNEQLKDIQNHSTILCTDLIKKNTAPALTYCMNYLLINYAFSNIFSAICLPSDHYIENEELFVENVRQVFDYLENGREIAVLGITPDSPSTEFGYIDYLSKGNQKFVEKPSEKKANEYIANGYLWNAGIFGWRSDVFFEELSIHCNEIFENIEWYLDYYDKKEKKIVEQDDLLFFRECPSISIDYALMEKTNNIKVFPIKKEVGWIDLGTWGNLLKAQSKGLQVSPEALVVLNRVTDKPWGFEELWVKEQEYSSKILFIKKGHRLSKQYHEKKKESIRVISGIMEIVYSSYGAKEDFNRVMKAGDFISIAPKTVHRMKGLSDCVLIEVSTSQLDDVIRFEDDYGRVK